MPVGRAEVAEGGVAPDTLVASVLQHKYIAPVLWCRGGVTKIDRNLHTQTANIHINLLLAIHISLVAYVSPLDIAVGHILYQGAVGCLVHYRTSVLPIGPHSI